MSVFDHGHGPLILPLLVHNCHMALTDRLNGCALVSGGTSQSHLCRGCLPLRSVLSLRMLPTSQRRKIEAQHTAWYAPVMGIFHLFALNGLVRMPG